MNYENNEGILELQRKEELDRVLDKIIKAHNPKTPNEYYTLCFFIQTEVSVKISLLECEQRSKRMNY